jgi:uncharacterized membrane protein YgdD (TMEM256/DUF423 family)
MARFFLAGGAIAMALAVALGAYSTHGSRNALHPDAAHLLQTAILYQMVHAIGVLLAGVLARDAATPALRAAGLLHIAGIVLFCGSLWWLAFTGKSLGLVAPAGGLCFIAGWIAFAVHAFAADRAAR